MWNRLKRYVMLLKGNQRIIAGNAQFTGFAAGRGVGFTSVAVLIGTKHPCASRFHTSLFKSCMGARASSSSTGTGCRGSAVITTGCSGD